MQAQNSSFQKISVILPIVLLFLSLTQCTADAIWGIEPELLRERLIQGQRDFLRELQIEKNNLAEAFQLGPGAPLYLSRHFASIGRDRTAEQLLVLQWRRGDSPWKQEAALQLIDLYLSSERFAEAEHLAARVHRRAPSARIGSRAERALVEAMYWQQKDEEVLEILERLRAESWDAELDLFRAVSSRRLEKPQWRRLFIDLFFNNPTSALHSRAFAFLEQGEDLVAFSTPVAEFFRAKDLLYRGRNAEAIELLSSSLPALQPQRPDMQIVFSELGTAYLAESLYDTGAERLLDLAAELPPQDRLDAVEMAGRLHRKGGDFAKAEQLLTEVVRDTTSTVQRDRAVWFLLDMARRASSESLLTAIESFAPGWHEPRYFGDILEAEISRIIARGNWEQLLSLYRTVAGYAPPYTTARLAYLTGRSIALGLSDPGASFLSPQALFLQARDSGRQYYRFLAETALTGLGFPPRWELELEDADIGFQHAADDGDCEKSSLVCLIRGYFEYGLPEIATELLRSRLDEVPPRLLVESAEVLQSRGEYLSSIRLMSLYASGSDGSTTVADLKLMYPKAYNQWIEEVSAEEELPAPLFFALVREESLFDPQIVSRSGAVGLTQLMVDTAADAARWLRMEEYDLHDPRQNLRLGAMHFSRQLGRVDNFPKALMAYNAGLSRVRSWEGSFPSFPVDLMVEAIPYAETRNYVRKILVSAVYYGALYYDRSLEQTVLQFFPGLDRF